MLHEVESYLRENIDETIVITKSKEMNELPLAMRTAYNHYDIHILDEKCLLIEVTDEMPSIENLKKHIKLIESLIECRVVILCKRISLFRRKSLISNRIPFVIMDGQMFLPFIGMDLKKGIRSIDYEKSFSAAAQLAYLYFLYNKDSVVNMTDFALEMNLSNMAASRALNELYLANLIYYEVGGKTGRSKAYKRISDKSYYEKGKDFLRSPIKKTVYAHSVPIGSLPAGLDALSDLSMLNPPDHPIVAIHWKQFDTNMIQIEDNMDIVKDLKLVEIQLWNYDPSLFAQRKNVDLLSLYLSIKDMYDERILSALDGLMRGEEWYTD